MAKKDSNFFEKVYEAVKLIPKGKVTSYGAIAKSIGAPGSARMVGWALNNSPKEDVPAHRVVNRNGLLTGKSHFGGSFVMQQMLENEGVKVVNNSVENFEKYFWEPPTLL
ncbi:MAG TPA: MGMT family protein [Salinimicrobium sp.]|nr:MGMT family protein [Salinimicrobium sp.]